MSQGRAVTKARAFATTAYAAAVENITKEFDERLHAVKSERAAKGTVLSGGMVKEAALINGQRITALLQARLHYLLEGYELHSVHFDDELSANTVDEIMRLREALIDDAMRAYKADPIYRVVAAAHYLPLLEGHIVVTANSVKTQFDRVRFTKKSEVKRTVIASGLVILAAAGFGTAQVLSNVHPVVTHWVTYFAIVFTIAAVAIPLAYAFASRTTAIKWISMGICLILALAFWRYRPVKSTQATVPGLVHVESHGNQSPNVVGNEGSVQIENSSGAAEKTEKPKPKDKK